ncbi:MAG: hypothetical protein A2X86_21490 [Bdellovibrionales bacterium GWA2_49_15]|nr:MAG: hypothetical protein A2X86_21490 [Bdellovibrionales bacterium GWA2_49_15]HAZ14954.1 ABC transporter permease [Bdellovibrionales bacterium]
MRTFFIIAFRNITKSRTRSLLLGFAIAAVTTVLVVLHALTNGIQDTIMQNAMSLSSGHVNIAGFYKLSQTSAAPIITKKDFLKKLARENIPEAALIIERIKGWGKIISDQESIQVPMWGVDIAEEKEILSRLSVLQGNLQDLSKRGSIVIFGEQAKKLKVAVGDTVTISMPTYRNQSNTMDVKVVAILRDMGLMSAFSVFAHHQDIREIYQMGADSTGQVMIYLKDLGKLAIVEDRLRRLIPENGFKLMDKEANPFWMKFERVAAESWTGQKIDITNWRDETSFVKWIIDIFNAITIILTSILLFIVILGLMNTLWISIRERTSEIGTLRAIGLQKGQVTTMFVLEAFILATFGTVFGVIVGSLISKGLSTLHIPIRGDAFKMFLMADTLTLTIHPTSLFIAFFTITFFVTLGALFPSYKASKLKPITAMGHID